MLLSCLAVSNEVQELRSDCELLTVSVWIVFQSIRSTVTPGQHSSAPSKWAVPGEDGMQAEGRSFLPPQKRKRTCAALNTSAALFLYRIVSLFHLRGFAALCGSVREAQRWVSLSLSPMLKCKIWKTIEWRLPRPCRRREALTTSPGSLRVPSICFFQNPCWLRGCLHVDS